MRAVPLTVLKGGINRLRVKGGASPQALYDLVNGYINNSGAVVVREGTIRDEALDDTTVGLMSMDGLLNVFSTTLVSVPSGYADNVLVNPNNPALTLTKIWFAKPIMGFPYVVAQFSDGSIVNYWLQSNGTWAADTVYMTGAIVTPDTPNGLAYQAQRNAPVNSLWTPNTVVSLDQQVEPNTYTGYFYRAVAVAGSAPHTGGAEPIWPTSVGATIQEFGDFDLSSSDTGTTGQVTSTSAAPLGSNITDRYGDSQELAGQSGAAATGTPPTVSASTAVTTWAAGTTYAPGAVVQPSTGQGAFIDAIPNGDFEAGDDGDWTLGTGWTISTSLPYQGNYCAEYSFTGAQNSYITMFNYGVVTVGQPVTASCYAEGDSDGAIYIVLRWYDADDNHLSDTQSTQHSGGGGINPGAYSLISVTGSAPANAAHLRVGLLYTTGSTHARAGRADLVVWNLETPAAVSNFLFEAVQAAPAASGSTEPAWPTVEGDTVIDGGVTWEAIGTSIITWQAIPIMLSGGTAVVATFGALTGGSLYTNGVYNNVPLTGGAGSGVTANITVSGGAVTAVALVYGGSGYAVGQSLTTDAANIGGTGSGFSVLVGTVSATSGEPAFPTTIGTSVNDQSTYTDINGVVLNTSMSWVAIDRHVSDSNVPNTSVVAIGATHIFEGNNDITSYSAAVNPIDWSTPNNAGFLPTGLNNYGDNPVAVLALYRSNLMVFNAGGYQMWQIDPDPANMALLDAQPVGSIYTRAAQTVANDLLILTEVGVRNIGVAGAQANLAVGNLGQPIDPLVKAQLQTGTYGPTALYDVKSLYYPGRGQYWLIFGPQAFVLTINGTGQKTWSRYVFPDIITDWTLLDGVLYLRSAGNLIWQVDAATLVDDAGGANVAFEGVMQWPYLDLGPIGENKMLIGLDLVGTGEVTIQIGFNQTDLTTFSDNAGFDTSLNVTPPYTITAEDTDPYEPIPIPCNAPSYTLILTFTGNQSWNWQAANLYLSDETGRA
jgi:hypothetical protein